MAYDKVSELYARGEVLKANLRVAADPVRVRDGSAHSPRTRLILLLGTAGAAGKARALRDFRRSEHLEHDHSHTSPSHRSLDPHILIGPQRALCFMHKLLAVYPT